MAVVNYEEDGIKIINDQNEKLIVSEHSKGLLIEIIKEELESIEKTSE